MIGSFLQKDAERLFRDLRVPGFKPIEDVARRKLISLHASKYLEDLSAPASLPVQPVGTSDADRYSAPIDGPWQLHFDWRQGHAYNVEIVNSP